MSKSLNISPAVIYSAVQKSKIYNQDHLVSSLGYCQLRALSQITCTARSIEIVPRGKPHFQVDDDEFQRRIPILGLQVDEFQRQTPFWGLYVDEFQKRTPFWGMYADEFQRQTPHCERDGSSGISLRVKKKILPVTYCKK